MTTWSERKVKKIEPVNKHERNIVREDISDLKAALLDGEGLYKAVTADVLHRFHPNKILTFANDYAIYQFVTTELLEWLINEIGNKKAIEICAGNGVIARTLGIIGIDSWLQSTKYFQRVLTDRLGALANQFALTQPPRCIKKYEAMDAVRTFRPEVVIGAFITPKVTREMTANGIQGNGYGPDMVAIIKRVKKVIHFGNINTHLPNPIYDLPHRELSFPWLVTRAHDQALNRVWIWENT